MPPPLAFIVPQMAYYGFLGTYFTHSLGFVATGVLLFWVFLFSIAQYRDESVFDLNLRVPFSLVLGAVVGLLFSWALQLMPLLRWELWAVGWRVLGDNVAADDHANNGRAVAYAFDATLVSLVVSLASIVAGEQFLIGNFEPEVAGNTSLVLGVLLLLFGFISFFWILFFWLWRSPGPGDWLTMLGAMAIIVLALVPLLFNVLLSIRPLNQVVFHIGLIVTTTVFAALHVRFFKNLDSNNWTLLYNDVRAAPSQASAWRIALRWFLFWFVSATIYALGGIALEVSDDSLSTTLFVVAFGMLFLTVIAIVLGYFRRSSWAHFYISRTDVHTNHYLAPSDTSKIKGDTFQPVTTTTGTRFGTSAVENAAAVRARRSQLATSYTPPEPEAQELANANYNATIAAMRIVPKKKGGKG